MNRLSERKQWNTAGGEMMKRVMRITNGWMVAVVAMALGLACASVNAETIATQTFDDDQGFNTGGQTSWTDGLGNTTITYTGTGLGFEAASKANPEGIRTTAGTLQAGHMSSSGTPSAGFDGTGKYAPPTDIGFLSLRSGFALFDTVDLSGHDSSTMTLDLTTSGVFVGNDDAMFVRLYLDGSSTGIDILKMYDDANTTVLGPDTTFAGGTLTYTFDDAVNNAELIIGFDVDDSTDDYIIDNVVFAGTPGVPAPYVTLPGPRTAAANAAPGTLIGNVSMQNTNGTFAFSLQGVDAGNFSIASGSTNLRTAVWMSAGAKNISIVGSETGGGGLVVTNDFVITVTASDYISLKMAAGMDANPTGPSLVASLDARPGSGTSFEVASGREDLFEIDGTGTNLVQIAGSNTGPAGGTHYVELKESNAGVATDAYYVIEATVGAERDTLNLCR
jgi:hypothetical protein